VPFVYVQIYVPIIINWIHMLLIIIYLVLRQVSLNGKSSTDASISMSMGMELTDGVNSDSPNKGRQFPLRGLD
jgi:hypothetical protein